jgi:hypothetical protein
VSDKVTLEGEKIMMGPIAFSEVFHVFAWVPSLYRPTMKGKRPSFAKKFASELTLSSILR